MQTSRSYAGIRPPRIAMGLLAIAFGLHRALPAGEALRFSAPVAGAVAGAAGFGLMMWAWWVFKLKRIPVCPGSESGTLASGGPFRITRNPMYLGMLTMLLGVALWVGTPPFYAAALIFFGVINWVFIAFEEQKLEKDFGAAYSRYRSNVRRWV
jgi:protein-S-isoprenylcysteine O-methyltransferase Ste14